MAGDSTLLPYGQFAGTFLGPLAFQRLGLRLNGVFLSKREDLEPEGVDRMRGYGDAQARQVFCDLIDTPADVTVAAKETVMRFYRRAHPQIILASGLLDEPVKVPW